MSESFNTPYSLECIYDPESVMLARSFLHSAATKEEEDLDIMRMSDEAIIELITQALAETEQDN